MHALVWIGMLALTGAASAGPAWVDFESAALSDQWTAQGAVTLKRETEPAGGRVLRIEATGRGAALTKAEALPLPAGLPDCEALRLRVRKNGDGPFAFDVLLGEADRHAAFWRKVEVTESGWQEVSLPLRWFRWETGRVPRWNEVRFLALRARGAGSFAVDDLRFVDEEPQSGADYTPAELAELAFGAGANVRMRTDQGFWLMTDSPDLDIDALAAHLVRVREAIGLQTGIVTTGATPARLLVFATAEGYRTFTPRFAARLGAVAEPPTSNGYHLQGVALSSWDPKQGTLRPVYAHEFCHSVLSHAARIDSAHSDWWQEGFANHFQLQFHPQDSFSAIVRQGLADASYRSDFEKLCAGEDVPMNRYWQVATLFAWLLDQKRESIEPLMTAFRRSGSTDLRPHLEEILRMTWPELDEAWRKWCAAKYGP